MRQPERAIHKAVAAHLVARGATGMFWWHTPNGGRLGPIKGAILKSMGVKAGIPDILALHKGQLYGLELKAGAGKLSAHQWACQGVLRNAGAVISTAKGLDDAINILESWGLLRSGGTTT